MRDIRFTFLCTCEERQLLTAVAQRLSRTESDVVRQLIRMAARELNVAVSPPALGNDLSGDESGEARQDNVG